MKRKASKKRPAARKQRPSPTRPRKASAGNTPKARRKRRPTPRRRAASPSPTQSLAAEVKRLRAARRRLERRLTALVQEIGQLRHFELRNQMLVEELKKRDEEILALRRARDDLARARLDPALADAPGPP